MRTFDCDRCTTPVGFEASVCPACRAELGYVSGDRNVHAMSKSAQRGTFRLDQGGDEVWRCLNAAWGCNWVVAADSASDWCRSCALTRGRPCDGRTEAIESWIEAESAKRQLIHQLDQLALPVQARSEAVPHGLAFDLVEVEGLGGVTGHLDGVITLDLAEIDEQHRADLRRSLDEPIRTVIGHLRHEVGHHYWSRLVGETNDVAHFRTLFGDERSDYAAALERRYGGSTGDWDPESHITPYARAHPLEDWAESFGHYLHILDAFDTAGAHGLVADDKSRAVDFGEFLNDWRTLNTALTAIAGSLGVGPLYPIDLSGRVVDKLTFVHCQIAAHTARDRFYAEV